MTLIEITVSVAVFLVAALAVTQIFVTSVRMQRAFLAKTEAMNESSYLMEYISRAIRAAQKDMTSICGNGNKANFGPNPPINRIKFMIFGSKCQEFYTVEGALLENKDGVISRLTSPDLTVENFNVALGAYSGWEQPPVDYLQPRVTVSLQIKDKTGSDFILQTSVSQRSLDIWE